MVASGSCLRFQSHPLGYCAYNNKLLFVCILYSKGQLMKFPYLLFALYLCFILFPAYEASALCICKDVSEEEKLQRTPVVFIGIPLDQQPQIIKD
jgi:hypothetical protein